MKIHSTGFREYDCRWLYEEQVDIEGLIRVGHAFAEYVHIQGFSTKIVVGCDFRSYSVEVMNAVITGLRMGGLTVHNIGVVTTPVAYWAQYELECPLVAMITASHNPNGWTGVKFGTSYSRTLSGAQMSELRKLSLSESKLSTRAGSYYEDFTIGDRYIASFTQPRIMRPLKVVINPRNSNVGMIAYRVLQNLGCEVTVINETLDFSYPNGNPNPEDPEMMRETGDAVRSVGADIGFAFDGDGDRLGVVDNNGRWIHADKVGLIIARILSYQHPNRNIVVDVKSTNLFKSDKTLENNRMNVFYGPTGHSYMKQNMQKVDALMGFEKSGHFFFDAPYGRGYDDAVLAAVVTAQTLAQQPRSLAQLYGYLPKTFASPALAVWVPDESKYRAVAHLTAKLTEQPLDTDTTNGIRVTWPDGSWALARASSNEPKVVVLGESPISEERMVEVVEYMKHLVAESAHETQYL